MRNIVVAIALLLLFLQSSHSDGIFNGGSGGGGGGSGTVTDVTINTSGGGANTGTCTSTTIINCTISTQLVTVATITSSGNVLSTYAGQQVIGNAATAQTLTLQGITTSQYLRFINKGAGTWTLSAGTGSINSGCVTVAQNQSADIQFDGTNWNIACGSAVTAVTQTAGDNTTLIATDAFVTTAVNNAIAGVNPAVAVQVATTAAGDTSALTYNNGASGIGATFTGANNTAITIDGVTFTTVGQRLLVKNDTQSPSGAFNGVYSLTAVQTSITGAIFTRALDYDTPSDMNNTGAIPVTSGTANATTSWLLTSSITTVGTSPLTYAQFSISPTNLTNASNLTSGTLPAGRMPALTGNCVTVAGAVATTCDQAHPGYITGNWYSPTNEAFILAAGNTVLGTTTIMCRYATIPHIVTVEALAARVATASAGGAFSVALYQNSAGLPGALIAYTRSGDVSTTNANTTVSGSTYVGGNVTNGTQTNVQLGPNGAQGGRDIWECFAADNTTATWMIPGGQSAVPMLAYMGNPTLSAALGTNTSGSEIFCTGTACNGSSQTCCTSGFTWPANMSSGTTWTYTATIRAPFFIFESASTG